MMRVATELAALFRDATRRQRLVLAALVSIMFGTVTYGCSWAGAIMGGFVPVKRTVVTRHIDKIEHVVVQRPPRQIYPALRNPKDACTGAPVVIESVTVSGWEGQKAGDKRVKTWVSVRPLGDDYTVQCRHAGDYSSGWPKGAVTRLYGGEVSE